MMKQELSIRLLAWMVTLIVVSGWVAPVKAHEIPSDVTVQIYLKPETDRLTALVRVPLAAMRDFEFAARGPGYLDLAAVEPQLVNAVELWLVGELGLFQEGVRLGGPEIEAVRIALPSDSSFDDFATARQGVYSQRLDVATNLYWEQALLDAALVYPIVSSGVSDGSGNFEIEPSFARLGQKTVTQIRFVPQDGATRRMGFIGDPGRISLDPGAVEVFGRFLKVGFAHVLDGLDHLLFVFVLIIPLMRIRPLIVVITAFTLAHSITLAAPLLDLVPRGLWFPPFVELLIAASILYMALENLLKTSMERRWLLAFGFGLVHGFGFSFALTDTLQFAGDHVLASLAGFNLGIEFGQILLLVVTVPVLRLAGRWLPPRGLAIALSVLVAHTAWHWLVERWEVFGAYSISVPALDVVLLALAMRWLMLILAAAFVVWLVREPFERWAGKAARIRDRSR